MSCVSCTSDTLLGGDSSGPQGFELSVQSDLKSLATVLNWFEQLKPLFQNETLWLQCEIALAEGFTNAVRHAHRQRSRETPVKLQAKVLSDRLELCIWDQGSPFDLINYLQSLPEKSSRDAEGGRGLQLLRVIADALSYTRTDDNQNCLRIIKSLGN
jgi:serine/threonine-protein kinase RsbW